METVSEMCFRRCSSLGQRQVQTAKGKECVPPSTRRFSFLNGEVTDGSLVSSSTYRSTCEVHVGYGTCILQSSEPHLITNGSAPKNTVITSTLRIRSLLQVIAQIPALGLTLSNSTSHELKPIPLIQISNIIILRAELLQQVSVMQHASSIHGTHWAIRRMILVP